MKRIDKILAVAVIAGLIAFCIWRFISIPKPIQIYAGYQDEIRFTVTGYLKPSAYGYSVPVNLENVNGTLYLQEQIDLHPGDLITCSAQVKLREWSSVHFTASCYGTPEVNCPEKTPLVYLPALLAEKVKLRISELFLGESAAMLSGLLIGDRSGFTDDLNEDLFTTGLTHVMAVSGLHISMFAGFVVLLVGNRRHALPVALPLVFCYIALSGFSPSALRAGIMYSVYIYAAYLGREYSALRSLIAAFLILCALNPYTVFEPGMQLSFTSTLGLILFAPRLKAGFSRRLGTKNSISRYLSSGLSSSFAALVLSLPVAAYWFGGVSLISPLTNLALLWLVNIVFILGSICVGLSFIWMGAANALSYPITFLLRLIRYGLEWFGKIPCAVLYTAQVYMLVFLTFTYFAFVVFFISKRWKAPLLCVTIVFTICISLTVWQNSRGTLEIAVLDVGQGQCVVIRSGSQAAVIDCGGLNSGREAVRFLKSRGINEVSLLVLTHYDLDHSSGVPALMERINVNMVTGPAITPLPDGYALSLTRYVESYEVGEAIIELLPAGWTVGSSNENCLSALITYKGFTALITGDLGQAEERWLMRRYELPKLNLYIAGHHGSEGSSSEELLDTLKPETVIISVGVNSYGHPAAETLERYYSRGINFYTTVGSGTVIVNAE